jgi:hypothetical protein
MGTETTIGTTKCPKKLTVTLAGQTSSSWATEYNFPFLKQHMAAVATGPTAMGMGTASGTLTCPKTLTVTLAG